MPTPDRLQFRFAMLAAALYCIGANPATAAESIEELLADARRQLEVAKIDYRHFWHVERPRQRRELNAAIRLTQQEVDALQERVRYYRDIDEFRTHRPLLESLQCAELALLAAELRLADLWAERAALRWTLADRCRLCELAIAEARARVIELERVRQAE